MNELQKKVLSYIKGIGGTYAIVRMAELAPGIIAVEDSVGECDAYFDIAAWDFVFPSVHKPDKEDPELKSMGVQILPGLSFVNPARTIKEMKIAARNCLKPKQWHARPRFLKLR